MKGNGGQMGPPAGRPTWVGPIQPLPPHQSEGNTPQGILSPWIKFVFSLNGGRSKYMDQWAHTMKNPRMKRTTSQFSTL